MAGALAITAAAGGAVSAGITEADAASVAPASAVKAPTFAEFETLGIANRLDDRQHAISRDSERLATQATADQKMQQIVERQAHGRTAALAKIARASNGQARRIKARNAWTLPTTGYHLTGRFGQSSGLWANNHTGLDFATTPGTPIVAVAGGTITETGWAGSYGNRTIETLPDGTVLWYAHQLQIKVTPGQVVRSGEPIGEVGSTGNSTGSHVHLEVRPGGGDPVDPYTALIYHGLQP